MESKDTVRRAVRVARRTRTEQRRRTDADALAAVVLAHGAVAGAGVVAIYESTPTEPGTAALRAALAARGATVLLPVVVPAGPLAWAVDGGSGTAHDDLLAQASVVLLPALAVTSDGHRLGQGGGHYDRTLAALPTGAGRPLLVALVHDDEVLAPGAWPAEDHDVRVDAAATPGAWVDLARGWLAGRRR